tara:strand:- start:11031 stop:11519 length:489 start_codon:yes stop_codon:yes gene_type:complete
MSSIKFNEKDWYLENRDIPSEKMSSLSDIKCGDVISYTHTSIKDQHYIYERTYAYTFKRFRNGKVIRITDCFIETEHEGFSKKTSKKCVIDIVIHKKKLIPFIIESDSEEESDEESDDCANCHNNFHKDEGEYHDEYGEIWHHEVFICHECAEDMEEEEEEE